jgi:hypothetical protein
MPDETAQPAAEKPTEEELYEEFEAAMAAEEFDAYRQQKSEIKAGFAHEIDQLRSDLTPPAQSVQERRLRLLGLGWSGRVIARLLWKPARASALIKLLVSMLAASSIVFAVLKPPPPSAGWMQTAGVGLGCILYGYLAYLSIMIYRSDRWRARDDLWRAVSKYDQERARLVREAVRRQVTEVFRASGVITFPMLAPTLVELSTAKIASSRTHKEVIDFIRSHETSAIGLAGSRGSGKSTSMEAVRSADGLASHQVLLTAPVKYEPLDFIRRLFADVATEIVKKSGQPLEDSHETHRRRLARHRMLRDVLVLGAFLVLTGVVIMWTLDHSAWTWGWREAIGFAGTAVLVVIVITTALSLLVTLKRSADSRTALSQGPESVRMARRALDDLAWITEEGQKEAGSVKVVAGLLTVRGEDSVTRKQRELSQPELVARFRKMLTQYSLDRKDPAERFVIFIDELDKLDEIDDLVSAINGIKDLLHLPGVHFVVSVSVDALVRFEERGMAARDAFDSAFDTVIRTRRLALDESHDILSSRAANFPAVLVLVCHAWSGGLARDLLRNARRCVEIQRRSAEVVHVSTIMLTLVTDDLMAHIENALRAEDVGKVRTNHLTSLRRTVRAVAAGADPLAELRQLTDNRSSDQIDHVTLTGLALLSCVSRGQADERRWEQPPSDWNPCVEALATAMAARAEPATIREETLDNALDMVLTVTGSGASTASGNGRPDRISLTGVDQHLT